MTTAKKVVPPNGVAPWESVPIELNGEQHHLRFVSKAWEMLEAKFEIDFNAMAEGKIGPKDLDKLIWAGLLHETRGQLSWDDFGWEFDTREITTRAEELMECVGRAMGASQAEIDKSKEQMADAKAKAQEGSENGEAPLPPALMASVGAGSSSGPSDDTTSG